MRAGTLGAVAILVPVLVLGLLLAYTYGVDVGRAECSCDLSAAKAAKE